MAFEIKIKGLEKLRNAIRKAPRMVHSELSNAIKTSLYLLRPIVKKEIPVGKNVPGHRKREADRLRQSLEVEVKGLEGSIGPNLITHPYGLYVHEGTSPYIIKPRRKKVLCFYTNGKWVFAKRVRHPGIKANPYMERAFDEGKPHVEKIFQKSIYRIISNIQK